MYVIGKYSTWCVICPLLDLREKRIFLSPPHMGGEEMRNATLLVVTSLVLCCLVSVMISARERDYPSEPTGEPKVYLKVSPAELARSPEDRNGMELVFAKFGMARPVVAPLISSLVKILCWPVSTSRASCVSRYRATRRGPSRAIAPAFPLRPSLSVKRRNAVAPSSGAWRRSRPSK